jgi:methionyl-tRNA synthetase
MIEKYCDGVIPKPVPGNGLADQLALMVVVADNAICALDFQGGINAIMEYCKKVNGYVTDKEPWAIAKDESRITELNAVLYNTAEALRALAVLLHSVMPETAEKLWSSLGADISIGDINFQLISNVATWGQLPKGSRVTKGAVLFPRLEEK